LRQWSPPVFSWALPLSFPGLCLSLVLCCASEQVDACHKAATVSARWAFQCQKRPITVSKEIYYSFKRDLCSASERSSPVTVACVLVQVCCTATRSLWYCIFIHNMPYTYMHARMCIHACMHVCVCVCVCVYDSMYVHIGALALHYAARNRGPTTRQDTAFKLHSSMEPCVHRMVRTNVFRVTYLFLTWSLHSSMEPCVHRMVRTNVFRVTYLFLTCSLHSSMEPCVHRMVRTNVLLMWC
jgi:hypothetical protein